MDPLRDYVTWHQDYADPSSGLSWRLQVVRGYLAAALEARPGPVRLLSLCSGDGRDVLGVLAGRPDAARVRAVLVELHPVIADDGRMAAQAAGLAEQVEVRTADAARPAGYADAYPADVVLLVGIFGNISIEDLWRTIDSAAALCRPGAAGLWSRGRQFDHRNGEVRARFTARGFTELAYDEHPDDDRGPALGLLRYDGPPRQLDAEATLFTFVR